MPFGNNEIKLAAYVDESGQDTSGIFFIVSVVVTTSERSMIIPYLERIEKESGKRNMKWRKAGRQSRFAYFSLLLRSDEFQERVFVEIWKGQGDYIKLTATTTAKAILTRAGKRDYRVTVFVDGLKKKEREEFTRGLRELRVKTRKIRGVKRDENDALIRLADAFCGLVRDVMDGDEEAKVLLARIRKSGKVVEL